MAKMADMVIDVGVKREACPLGLAPTASSTALLAMGDALAVVLSNRRRFKSDDFKKIHPGGALGQRLAGRVSDIMMTGGSVPVVYEDTEMKKAVVEMNRLTLGVTLVVKKEDNTLSGIITDGDLRRYLLADENLFSRTAKEVMTRDPLVREPDSPAYDALNLMEKHEITVLPICDNNRRVQGILHLHDILGKGEFKFNGS
jgi:arabinose-5-phosphate isomerase